MTDLEQKILNIYKEINLTDSDEIRNEKIRKIGKILLESQIKFGGTVIEPLFVEGYFGPTNDPKKFDFSIHGKQEQQGNKDKPFHFYLHPKCGRRGGIDLVIGDNPDYMLSFLLKVCFFNGEKLYQSYIANKFTNKPVSDIKIELVPNKKDKIKRWNYSGRVFTKTNENKQGYDFLLAVFTSENEKFSLEFKKVSGSQEIKSNKPQTIYTKFKELKVSI